MAQNIYDDPDFFAGYSRLPRQVLGLDGAPEWPVLSGLFPDLEGKSVADLGCGFGWTARWMREMGAASVLGIDLSEKMISRARAATNDSAIAYEIADLDLIDVAPSTFDLVFSSLAFHYLENWSGFVRKLAAMLKPGGDLLFTIEHPIFMAPAVPRWLFDIEGQRSWPVSRYFVEGERRTNWFAEGVVKYHRTIGTTLDGLADAGFKLNRLIEFVPDHQQLVANPALAEELDRPMILIIAASAQ